MALSTHAYDEPDEYQKCPKCTDTYHVDEVDWYEIGGYTICGNCVDGFLLEIIERENSDKPRK